MSKAEDSWKFQQKFLFDRQASPFERACPYEPRPSDVMICGARRTGTTWLQQILHEIRSTQIRAKVVEDEKIDIDRLVWYVPPYYERWDFDLNAEQLSGLPRLYKTHDCFEDAPKLETSPLRYIVVVRDPMDAVYSEKVTKYRSLGYDEDAIDPKAFLKPADDPNACDLSNNTYWDHFLSWWPHRHCENVLWIHYEDLMKNLTVCIERLAEFAFKKRLHEDEVKRIKQRCTFAYMCERLDSRFSGRFLTEIRCRTLGMNLWKPLVAGVRKTGGTSGQGEKLLDENTKTVVRWFWRQHVQPLTGYQSYARMHADMSILKTRGRMHKG